MNSKTFQVSNFYKTIDFTLRDLEKIDFCSRKICFSNRSILAVKMSSITKSACCFLLNFQNSNYRNYICSYKKLI